MRSLFRFSFLLTISFILIVCANNYAKASSIFASSPYDLLYEVMERSADVATVKTNFVQEKKVDFLNAPIKTSGHLYFAKHDNTYSLPWEYNAPSASGIWFHKGTSWMWAQTRDSLREPKGHENTFMNSMMQQMIFWLQINPKEIESRYNLELIEKRTVKLFPKYKDMFKSITVTFNADLKSLKNLVLDEGDGNFTSLSFFETEYNVPVISTFPDGTPLP